MYYMFIQKLTAVCRFLEKKNFFNLLTTGCTPCFKTYFVKIVNGRKVGLYLITS